MILKRVIAVLVLTAFLFSACGSKNENRDVKRDEPQTVYCDDVISVLILPTQEKNCLPLTIKYDGTDEWVLSSELCFKVVAIDGTELTQKGEWSAGLNKVLYGSDQATGNLYYKEPGSGEDTVIVKIAVDLCSDQWIEFEVRI